MRPYLIDDRIGHDRADLNITGDLQIAKSNFDDGFVIVESTNLQEISLSANEAKELVKYLTKRLEK